MDDGPSRDETLQLPPYSYVPGGPWPHPNRTKQNRAEADKGASALAPQDVATSPMFRRGVQLFDAGYYWEAHEAWEGLWHVAGRRGKVADFLKGLIHLAAAGVKAREGRPDGVLSHARRAAALFAQTAQDIGEDARYLGLRLGDLLDFSRGAEGQTAGRDEMPGPRVVFDFVLRPTGVAGHGGTQPRC